MEIGNDFFVCKYPVKCKQKISKFLIFFFEINENFGLLCA